MNIGQWQQYNFKGFPKYSQNAEKKPKQMCTLIWLYDYTSKNSVPINLIKCEHINPSLTNFPKNHQPFIVLANTCNISATCNQGTTFNSLLILSLELTQSQRSLTLGQRSIIWCLGNQFEHLDSFCDLLKLILCLDHL